MSENKHMQLLIFINIQLPFEIEYPDILLKFCKSSVMLLSVVWKIWLFSNPSNFLWWQIVFLYYWSFGTVFVLISSHSNQENKNKVERGKGRKMYISGQNGMLATVFNKECVCVWHNTFSPILKRKSIAIINIYWKEWLNEGQNFILFLLTNKSQDFLSVHYILFFSLPVLFSLFHKVIHSQLQVNFILCTMFSHPQFSIKTIKNA